MLIPGYEVFEEIHRGRKRIVYRGQRLSDKAPVIIKTLSEELPSAAEVAGLKREFDLIKSLRLEGIIKAYALETHRNNAALILEDVGGVPLRTLIDSKEIDLALFLEIGIQLAATLAALHQHNVIHKDIAPKNVIVNLQSRQVQLIDFSISSLLPQESQRVSHPNLLEGTLAYMSPEQTGRMNRPIDYRTDLYSLGVTFYEMIAGRLPFDSTDPLELVHSHIAKIPALPSEHNPQVPGVISEIVMKLLAKTAESRYQSAYGLQADLEACLAQWKLSGRIDGLIIGQRDFSDRFQIPQKLYGREGEIATLMAAFERVSEGATELLLVSGYSGIGKSALVNEVHKPIVKQRGYFISGKFDQFKRNIPYSAVIQALQELVRQLLTESEDEIAAWKSRLLEALSANGQIIVEVIREVELIIGRQPPVPELPPAESQNRFNLVFQRFIQVFTQKDHPLAIFLDDLQWADSATLKLLPALMADPNSHYLLMIGAYRDNEVSTAHPLMLALAEIRQEGAKADHIALGPLDIVHLNQLIAGTLKCAQEKSQPLAELVLHKTGGNPFFVAQFMKSLHQERLLVFDYANRQWEFDLARIHRQGMTDNVVTLMAGKIQRFSEAAQHVLKVAACIGNQFDLETLSIVMEESVSQTANDLWEAVQEGLIVPIADSGLRIADEANADFGLRIAERDSEIVDLSTPQSALRTPQSQDFAIHNPQAAVHRFLHDRVQQAAYALIPDDRKKAVHLKIGQLLLAKSDEVDREEKIFDLVNQLNFGIELLSDEKDRRELAQLNLAAGRKAKSSTAYQAALSYHKTGVSLLTENCWNTEYDLMLALHLEAAECEYLCGNFGEAEAAFDNVLAKAQSRLDRARVYKLKLIQYESMSRYHEAIRLGSEALNLFGLAIPESSERILAALESELAAIETLIGDRAIDSLIDLPAMRDPEMRMVMSLLTNLHTSCFLSGDKPLTLLNTTRMVHLSLAHGNSEESAYAYMLYASMHVVPVREDYKAGYEFGMLAQRLNEHFHDPAMRAKVLMNFAWAVNLWRMPMASCIPIGREAFRLGNETGMFVEAAYALFNDCWFALLSGRDLEACRQTCKANVEYTRRIKMLHFAGGAPQVILQWGLALQGLTESPLTFSDADFEEERFEREYGGQALFEMFYFDAKLAVLYTFEEHVAAREFAEKAERVIKDFGGTIWDEIRVYYHCLTLAAVHAAAPAEERHEIEAKLEAWNARMRKWADNSPLNFKAQHLIVSAETARVRGNDLEAMRHFEAAIAAAAEQECPRELALANELCARFWLQRGHEKIAAVFMEQARNVYVQWGAYAKVKDLDQRHPQLLAQARRRARGFESDTQTSQLTIGRRLESLDLQTVIKASQVISSEIVLSRLLEKLMRITMENAGAQKVILMLEQEGELAFKAEGAVGRKEAEHKMTMSRSGNDKDEAIVLHSAPLEMSRKLSPAIVNYVKRTCESLVLAHAASDPRFSHDPYVVERQPQSIFCLPILNQGRLIGVLYLENNATSDAFTPDRIELMRILSAQAAISLENARLYEDMKQEIADRKRAEQSLQRTAAELRFVNDLVEQTTQPMAVTDLNGRLLRFNHAYEELTGYRGDELRKMTYQQLTPASWREIEAQQVSQLLSTGQAVRFEKEYVRKDGRLVPLELVADIYRNAMGEPVYLYAFLSDITERKRAEKALRDALSEVEQLKNRLQAENIYLQEEIKTQQNFEEIVGNSTAIRKVFQNIERVARTDSTVLITGATGTGKELVARAIHSLSNRKERPLINVNCGALPAGLIESELFGHEKGAFTGATARTKGRFELAYGGTIFLDEIGELPLETQTKLLRVLQEQEFERVGGAQTLKVDVRVIAATNRQLDEAVKLGAFRPDLFYRLNIFPIQLPALHERRDDLPLLTNHFVNKYSRRMGKKIDQVSIEALEKLSRYDWPGNVRELANVIERAVILCDGGVLKPDHLSIAEVPINVVDEIPTLEAAERMHILEALKKTKGVVGGPNGAAKLLGLNRTTLLARMKKLGIERKVEAI